jgi:hypothetical protein
MTDMSVSIDSISNDDRSVIIAKIKTSSSSLSLCSSSTILSTASYHSAVAEVLEDIFSTVLMTGDVGGGDGGDSIHITNDYCSSSSSSATTTTTTTTKVVVQVNDNKEPSCDDDDDDDDDDNIDNNNHDVVLFGVNIDRNHYPCKSISLTLLNN